MGCFSSFYTSTDVCSAASHPILSCAVLCCAEIPHTVTENIPQLSICHSRRCPTWVYRPLLLHAILSPCSAPPSPSPVLPLHPTLTFTLSSPCTLSSQVCAHYLDLYTEEQAPALRSRATYGFVRGWCLAMMPLTYALLFW